MSSDLRIEADSSSPDSRDSFLAVLGVPGHPVEEITFRNIFLALREEERKRTRRAGQFRSFPAFGQSASLWDRHCPPTECTPGTSAISRWMVCGCKQAKRSPSRLGLRRRRACQGIERRIEQPPGCRSSDSSMKYEGHLNTRVRSARTEFHIS